MSGKFITSDGVLPSTLHFSRIIWPSGDSLKGLERLLGPSDTLNEVHEDLIDPAIC